MSKNLKRITTWLLSALASVALVLGIIVSTPQVKTASAADAAVSFNAAYVEGHDIEKAGYLQLRMDTNGETWTNSQNNKTLSDVPSTVKDYTTINGRTLTELQNACTSELPIIVTLQPAGSFSFIRVWIPSEFMQKSDVRSMGVLDGWAFNDGKANYTSVKTTFLYNGSMVLESAYTSAAKLTASDVTISDAQLVHRMHPNSEFVTRSTDSYMVDINIGKSIGEYDAMYDGYKKVRSAIYINGKSIDEWNSQMIAEDARFNEPSTYTYFPQNSTDPSHKQWFAKPIGLWGTNTGFRLSIFQELVAALETVEVTVGSGCLKDGEYMVSERISKTVLTQKVVDLTNQLTFLDNSKHNPESWGPTKLYFIHTNNESAWTKAPMGGCLNEADPSAVGGGQIQMKYITFNGSTLWDINKNDNGSYSCTQDNIKNGGVYAPILVTMSTELGASLKLTVPTNFTNGKAGHEEIVLKKGFSVKEGGTSYVVTSDITFTNNGTTAWAKEVKADEIETEVTGIKTYANRTDGGTNENFIIFELSKNDYAGLNTTAITDISSLFGYIDIGGNVLNAKPSEPFFNVWGTPNSITFRAPGLDAAGLQQVKYITIKAGAKFPAYTTQNGGKATYFVTKEDVTFVHNVPNDTWTVGTVASEFNVTFTVDGATYATQTVAKGATVTAPTVPTKAEDENYTYTFKQWTLNGAAYDFATPVTGDITLVAEFTATSKNNEVDITDEILFAQQTQQSAGTETYLIKTAKNYWTKAPQGGCLNEYDPSNAGGGQEQMKYIYFNGTSLYDINKNDNGSYGSSQGNIVNGGIYAPIMVFMGSDGGNYSYIQLHVPTNYADGKHESVEIKSGFSVTENGFTYVVTEDVKWVNLNGSWTNAKNLLPASEVSIASGVMAESDSLVKVVVSCSAWSFERDPYDYNYYSNENLVAMRKNIFVNGVSLFEINTTVDDSHYNYVASIQKNTHTGTYNNETYETFANPTYLYCSGSSMEVYIHKDYINSLGAGEITLTVGAGFRAVVGKGVEQSNPLAENVSKVVTTNYLVTVDGATQFVLSGNKAVEPSTPQKDMTSTATYVFENWYIVGTDTVFNFDTAITKDMEIEARFIETVVNMLDTEVVAIVHHLKTDRNDSWMIFSLTNHDYSATLNTAALTGAYTELLRIGFLDKIILKGAITLNNGSTVLEATLMDIYKSYGPQEGPFFNIWGQAGTFALRVPVGAGVEEIIIESGCAFPSYAYTSSATTTDTRYMVMQEAVYRFDESVSAFNKAAAVKLDIQMAEGASVRITSDLATSGIRFEVKIAKETVNTLLENEGNYQNITLGVIIVPTDYLMGGQFTHEWLEKNGYDLIDITYSLADLMRSGFPKDDDKYYSYFGTIGALKTSNYDRSFSGIGYVMFIDEESNVQYAYAQYNKASNSRSAAFVANAAINDRSAVQTENYKQYNSANNNYSPYTESENEFLKNYLTWSETSAINSQELTALASKGGSQTITPTTKKLAGPYVELLYSTNVNVWGQFTYTDGSKTATEDFYLQAGTTSHKQYLDIFRENAVGVGMNAENLSMTSIKFTNAELANSDAPAGKVKVIALYSQDKTIDMDNQEIYLTVKQADGSEITVGAHLGLGGALTYLAKSGIYEGVTASGYRSGNVKISTSTSDFVSERNTTLWGSKEKGYYGHATSSKAADGAVNLINNVDAGRQIQQSWYANVGGDTDGTDNGSNGYTRAFCKTESASGKYWPYNPVQAGDVVSNPSQIVDYEINTEKNYIYVKTRAMDWAKGQKSSDKLANTVVGGSTTKSYMENYYRLADDGTLTVNNAYVDWNGFTDMELAGWASTELPAVYPVHTLNYYVSNLDGNGSWTDGLEYNNGLGSWTADTTACRQGTITSEKVPYTMVEEWFAWANGGDGNAFAMGVYIPNVSRFTSGRARTTTAMSESLNKDAKSDNVLAQKGLMSNMQPIQYTYQSAYVSNTSYTAPGVEFRMEAYKPIEYSYVVCLGTVDTVRSTFKEIKDNGTVTNAGNGYEKVGLDAWARADKIWTW